MSLVDYASVLKADVSKWLARVNLANLFRCLQAIKCPIFGCVEIYPSAACVSNVSHRVATCQSLQTLGVCGVIKQVTKTALKRWTVTLTPAV